MKTFSALLALCEGNSPVIGEFPSQRPVTRSFDIFFDLCLNQKFSKQRRRPWFWTRSRSLWRHCNESCPSLWLQMPRCQHLMVLVYGQYNTDYIFTLFIFFHASLAISNFGLLFWRDYVNHNGWRYLMKYRGTSVVKLVLRRNPISITCTFHERMCFISPFGREERNSIAKRLYRRWRCTCHKCSHVYSSQIGEI